MAGCGYHSPQFSEDIAWLPEWLQPHQLPAFGDCAKDSQTFSQHAFKNLAVFQKSTSNGQDGPLFTRGDSIYRGCHLFLSGEDDSPVGNTPSSGNVLQFHLHLSSVDVSQISSGHLNEIYQTGWCETNKGLSRNPIPDSPEVHTSCQHKMEDEPPGSDVSQVKCKPRMSQKTPAEPLTKLDQNNQQRFQENLDDGSLKNADIIDAVELSISASEALVISEMASSGLQSEILPAAAILEIALRVKQARNQCALDILEPTSMLSTGELEETDQLCDFDENTMADAYDDVGLYVSQVVATPNNSFSGRIASQKYHLETCSSDVKQRSENHNEYEQEVQNEKFKAQVVQTCGTISQKNDSFSMELRSNNLPLEPLPVQQIELSGNFPLGYNISCKNQLKARKSKLCQNADALTAIQLHWKDVGQINKDCQVSTPGHVRTRKGIPEFFNGETSFISESMDIMDHTSERRAEAGSEIVASSSTVNEDVCRCTYEQNKEITPGVLLSQDLLRSSSLSFIDPLCSVVPCSIPTDDSPVALGSNQKNIEEEGRKFLNTTGFFGLQILNGKTTMSSAEEMIPSQPPAQDGEHVLSKITVECSGVPSRKQFTSLKPYSMVVLGKSKLGDTASHKESTSLNMAEKTMHLFPYEKNSNSSLSNKEDSSSVLLKPTNKYMEANEPTNSHSLGSKKHEKVDGRSATGKSIIDSAGPKLSHIETKDDEIGMLFHQHKERCSPLILNHRSRRLWACKTMLSSDCEDKSRKISSVPKTRNHRSENTINEVSFCDQANVALHGPLHSSLRLHPVEKQSLSNKRVRFSEAEFNIDTTKAGGRLQSGYQTHSSRSRTSRIVKGCSHRYKSEARRESFNSLANCYSMDGKGMIFKGLEFLLTGFSSQKEKELVTLIRKYGGYVLSNIPPCYPDLRGKRREECANWQLPIVLSPKKVQTTKFLYGCAINTWILNSNWLTDSVMAGSVMPPGKYMTRPIKPSERKCLRIGEPLNFNNHTFIFYGVGIMLYGKSSFCTKFSKIIKHGGGQVFKTLQRLIQSLKNGKNSVGAVLVEDEDSVSRHLKHCALEQNLQTLPSSWIINSLFSDTMDTNELHNLGNKSYRSGNCYISDGAHMIVPPTWTILYKLFFDNSRQFSENVMQLEVQSRTLSSVVCI